MDFQCFIRTPAGVKERPFLTPGAERFLHDCDQEVYEEWRSRNRPKPKDVSLAESLKAVVKSRFDNKSLRVREDVSDEYRLYWLFQHRKYTGGILVDIFRDHLKRGIMDFVVFTQSIEFKDKFQYDASTLTFTTFADDLDEFEKLFRPPSIPRILFVVFRDSGLSAFADSQPRKTYLRLLP